MASHPFCTHYANQRFHASLSALNSIYILLLAVRCGTTSDGLDGWVYRFICEGGPRFVNVVLRRVFGARCAGLVESFGDWVLNKPNRLLQGFYMLIVNGSFICFIFEVRSREPRGWGRRSLPRLKFQRSVRSGISYRFDSHADDHVP